MKRLFSLLLALVLLSSLAVFPAAAEEASGVVGVYVFDRIEGGGAEELTQIREMFFSAEQLTLTVSEDGGVQLGQLSGTLNESTHSLSFPHFSSSFNYADGELFLSFRDFSAILVFRRDDAAAEKGLGAFRLFVLTEAYNAADDSILAEAAQSAPEEGDPSSITVTLFPAGDALFKDKTGTYDFCFAFHSDAASGKFGQEGSEKRYDFTLVDGRLTLVSADGSRLILTQTDPGWIGKYELVESSTVRPSGEIISEPLPTLAIDEDGSGTLTFFRKGDSDPHIFKRETTALQFDFDTMQVYRDDSPSSFTYDLGTLTISLDGKEMRFGRVMTLRNYDEFLFEDGKASIPAEDNNATEPPASTGTPVSPAPTGPAVPVEEHTAPVEPADPITTPALAEGGSAGEPETQTVQDVAVPETDLLTFQRFELRGITDKNDVSLPMGSLITLTLYKNGDLVKTASRNGEKTETETRLDFDSMILSTGRGEFRVKLLDETLWIYTEEGTYEFEQTDPGFAGSYLSTGSKPLPSGQPQILTVAEDGSAVLYADGGEQTLAFDFDAMTVTADGETRAFDYRSGTILIGEGENCRSFSRALPRPGKEMDAGPVHLHLFFDTLTVSGSGPLEGSMLTALRQSLGDDGLKDVRHLVIEEGITRIDRAAIDDNSFIALDSAEIPASVTSIAPGAFLVPVAHVSYAGSEAQWNAVVGQDNAALSAAERRFAVG